MPLTGDGAISAERIEATLNITVALFLVRSLREGCFCSVGTHPPRSSRNRISGVPANDRLFVGLGDSRNAKAFLLASRSASRY